MGGHGGLNPDSTLTEPSAATPPPLGGDRYELGALLGRGGGGSVYEGFDRVLRRQVAIKVLRGAEASMLRTALFDREVRLLARLRHPHLIPFHDAWQDGRHRYLVMPLVEGATLAERIASGPVPAAEAQRIGTALAQALAYIHAHGVVHRDVKPANVLLGRDGRIFLADFGIARSGRSVHTGTRPSLVTGTAAYLAPEQVRGDETGSGCDVYSLGLVLLEALTGVRAYRGSALEQASARLWRQPELPISLGTGWVRLLDAMTARDPSRRPDAVSITPLLHRLEHPSPSQISQTAQTRRAPYALTSHAPPSQIPQTPQAVTLALPLMPATGGPVAQPSAARPPARRSHRRHLTGRRVPPPVFEL